MMYESLGRLLSLIAKTVSTTASTKSMTAYHQYFIFSPFARMRNALGRLLMSMI